MSEFGDSLVKSAKQAAEIAKGTAKPGSYRITVFENDKPRVIADFSEKVQAEMDAEIAAERKTTAQQPDLGQRSPSQSIERLG